MDNELLNEFLTLACKLSPENLTCDGELPLREVKARHRTLVTQWKALETRLGACIGEDDVWQMYMQRRDAA